MPPLTVASRTVGDAKQRQLNQYTVNPQDSEPLTTYWGTQVDKTDVSIRAGERGPTVLNDFHAREKIQKFDHERIPERIGWSTRNATQRPNLTFPPFLSPCSRCRRPRYLQASHRHSRALQSRTLYGHIARDARFLAFLHRIWFSRKR
jgi:hypothetical protein